VRFWGVVIAWLLSARLSVPSIDSSIDMQLTDYQYLLLAAARMHAADSDIIVAVSLVCSFWPTL